MQGNSQQQAGRHRQYEENDFQQMISNQQMQQQHQRGSSTPGTPTTQHDAAIKRKASAHGPYDSKSSRHHKSGKRASSNSRQHSRRNHNEKDNLREMGSRDDQQPESSITAQQRAQQLSEETFQRKNRVLEEISRRYETQIEQLTFTIHQKDQFFERQNQQWQREKAHLKKEYESRQNDLQEQIDVLVKQHRMDLASSIGTNPQLGVAGGASQAAAVGVPAGSGWIGMSDMFQNNKSQNMTNSHLFASQLSAQRSSQHRKLEKLEKKNVELQEQLDQSTEKLDRAENLVKLLEQQKKDAEKRCEKLKSKYDRDKELNQMRDMMKSVQRDAQKTLDSANKLKNENHELKKLNSQLKKMNERYFSVLRALNESEKVVQEKETQIHQLTEKFQRLSKRFKRSMEEAGSFSTELMDSSRKQHQSTVVVQRHEHTPLKPQALHAL